MLDLSIWMKLFWFALCQGLGFFMLIKTLIVRNLVGELPWAEQHLGAGGTYSLLKLWGIFFILLGFFLLFKG